MGLTESLRQPSIRKPFKTCLQHYLFQPFTCDMHANVCLETTSGRMFPNQEGHMPTIALPSFNPRASIAAP